MEPFMIDIAPTKDSDFILSSHEGEEFIMVMEGTHERAYFLKEIIGWENIIVLLIKLLSNT